MGSRQRHCLLLSALSCALTLLVFSLTTRLLEAASCCTGGTVLLHVLLQLYLFFMVLMQEGWSVFHSVPIDSVALSVYFPPL